MKLIQLTLFVLLSSFLTTGHAQQSIPFTDKRWTIRAQGQVIEGYKGKNSIYLQNGMAYIPDAGFLNGIIDFDVYLSYQTSFSGLVFRLTDPSNYEELYLRAQQSGYPDAYQYTPVWNGIPAWQLYHDQYDGVNDGFISWKPRGMGMGYNGTLDYSFDRWMHVRLLVKGKQAELYLDNKDEPVAFMRGLQMDPMTGGVGIKSQVGAAHFADFSFTVTDDIQFKTRDKSLPTINTAGAVLKWDVSSPLKESVITGKNELNAAWLNNMKWKEQTTDVNGLLNLARFAAIVDSNNAMLVRIKINSDNNQLKKLIFGYSDRVKVYCNGMAMYAGNTTFRTRDFRHLGTIGFYDEIYLPLKKGENEIIFAISETFGGWGIMAKWGD